MDLPDLGLRVSVTRARYPNRDDGVEQYAATITRVGMDHAPADPDVAEVLRLAFGELADRAVQRSGPNGMVRMFRVPVH